MIGVRVSKAIQEIVGVAEREFEGDHDSAIRLLSHALASYIITNAETCDEGCPIICPAAFSRCMIEVVKYALEIRDSAEDLAKGRNAYH